MYEYCSHCNVAYKLYIMCYNECIKSLGQMKLYKFEYSNYNENH